MRRVVIVAVSVVGVWACGRSAGEAETAADTLSRRQKDSIVSTLPVPGAAGVRRAQEAADRARERAALLDSIG